VTGFSASGTDPVTLLDPGAQRPAHGAFSLTLTGLDTRAGARSLAYTATGLPAGLALRSAPGSTKATLTGTLAASIAAGTTYHVVVTAIDHKTGASATTRFTITVT
jgi:hypothetical protein